MSAQQIPEPIAIVGSSCRFPGGSNTPSALWDLLKAPRDVGKKIPDDRFNPDGFHHPDGTHHGAANVKRSYLIDEDIRAFDAAFFNISPNEAESMDPQQRLLLETVYEALESGGHTIEGLRGSNTAVYAGTMTADYNDTGMRDLNVVPTYLATGVNRCIISNRVSYFFDWHGPSMTIDTACSSSLIAVHQGVTALRTGESRVALACGTQVILNPEMYIMESKLKMLSSFGESRMWDASAGGYARGEGVGAIVLKKLSDAIADGDHIECLIRETGTNQDGHSNGITVPNPDAQEALIRQTYARAGLDPVNNPQDRPQYFEAHGTGTKAGDPKEAAAIHSAFGQYKGPNEDPLYVGSIKTVIGHLEGAAGLAGLLKGKESIENGFIAPNLLFKNLNPDIEPFYKGLRVPTELTPWPKLEGGTPRRVSVNSFGFGGSNAHCILEQYIPKAETKAIAQSESVFTPFVFSAQTEQSLVAQLKALSEHFKNNKEINASDLSYTLQARRSQFPVRATYSATTLEALVTKIDAKLAPLVGNPNLAVGTRINAKAGSTPKILGVFTGQGAQWSTMGAQLIRTSAYASKMIDIMQDSLDSLPAADRPSWKIREQLLAPEGESRLGEAALSQPLCTVVQVILVDLLHAAGVKFSAVVGHSSGEIGAAYAAGFFSATDALRIAYYRGVHAKLAGNPSTGQKGAMMAVGTSWEDAQALISLETFKGRIAIAAHNSAASVTLSGDADAVVYAKKAFEEDKKFARLLKVDTAYHSHHMLPCGDAYVESLKACGVKVLDRKDTSCAWFSSVNPSSTPMEATEGLKDVYWKDNMCNAVLFTEAVVNAISSDEQLAVGLEVGPHPALKGPAAQSISEVRSNPLPYSGVLSRGANDVEALSDALGFLWTQLGNKAVDFQSFNAKVADGKALQSTLVRGMPRYQWNHATKFWNESRRSRRLRGPKPDMHEVLGVLLPESNPLDLRWSNVLKASEISWLEGHRLQGQSVFPGSGYVAMAIEASKHLAGDKKVELFELNDFTIPRALAFDEGDKSGVETQVTLTEVKYQDDETATAQFNVYSTPVVSTGSELELDLVASGSVRIVFGEPSADALSAAPLSQLNMGPVDMDRFYASLDTIGYGYSGPFKSLSSIMRKLDQASGQVASYPYSETDTTRYLVHPSTLDVAFHAGIAAFSAPGDERLWSLHVPTGIRSIRINPEVCNSLTSGGKVPVAARCDSGEGAFSAYIDIMSEDGQNCMLQVEELTLKPFAPGAEGDDRVFFTSTHYGTAAPSGADVTEGVRPTASEVELAQACERIALFYLRKWGADLTEQQWANGETHYKHLRSWVTKTLDQAKKGAAGIKREWNEDGKEEIDALVAKFSDSVDVQMIVTVGEKLPAAVRGEVSIEEHLALDNKLEEYKQTGLGIERYNKFMGAVTKQITYRYPHMNILEIGAGSGAATQHVLNEIGGKMRSYTYTDASADSFAQAAQVFRKYSDKMSFKTLDLSQEPSAQGYTEGAYDLVIASDSIHATQSLNTTLANARKLLRPGGYLLLTEVTNNEPVRTGFVRGALAGWWQGVDDGRKLAPTVTPGIWHSSLRKAGFSGVDVTTPVIDSATWPFSVMVAQAIDDRVKFLRQPLSGKSPITIDNLVICGNKGLTTACLAEELSDHLERFCGDLTVLEDLPTKDDVLDIPPMSTFIILADLDSPIFKDFGEEQMEGLQSIMELANHVLWITSGALIENPHHMGSIAFGRVVRREATHISLNHLDVSDIEKPGVSNIIAQHLLQSYAVEEWENDEQTQVLWSKEPEAFVENGKLVIPRLMSQVDQNARINSNRRTIMKELPISTSNATLVPRSESSPLSLIEPAVNLQASSSVVSRIDGSTQMALGVAPDTFLFVAAGEESVLLSATNSKEMAPIVTIPAEGAAGSDQSRLIIAVASELLAESLLQPISSGSHLMVHCSITDRFLTAALSRQASAKDVKVTFTTDAKEKQIGDSSWIKFSSRESLFTTKKTLAKAHLTHFLDLTAGTSDISLRLAHSLPSACQQIYTASIVREASNLPSQYDVKALETRLQSAYSQAKQSGVLTEEKIQDLVVRVDDLSQAIAGHTTGAVHWPSEGSVKVNVRYVQGNGLFSKEKSYLLVGLSGKIGQSLAEWMVSSGAGCVILTSRNPKVDEEWLNFFKGTGSTVKVASMDATDMRSVENAIKNIRATCLPIGGVANGAMVLHDTLFSKMTTEKMQQALAPKIEGSYNLDQAFFNDDLDFFVFFSSVACVMGNVGQSNYAAANAYQTSLARQRRRRGLAGSAFDIGQVVGVGYVETADQAVIDQLAALGGMSVSETDLRHALAETIITGRPNPKDMTSTPYAEVTTGIRHYLEDENVQGPWFTNAYFSHVVLDNTSSGDDSKDKDKKSNIPAAKQLQKASTKEEAFDTLKDCFAKKLAVILQLGDAAIDYDAPLADLGIDSLVAVEVRSWFLKEVKVDVPVLKVVGGATLTELCDLAYKKLPEDLLSGIGKAPVEEKSKPISPKAQLAAPSSSSSETASETNSVRGADTPATTEIPPADSVLDAKRVEASLNSKVSSKLNPSSQQTTTERPQKATTVSGTQRPRRYVKSVPLSLAQSRFWFLHQLLADQRTHNVGYYYHIKGDLNVADMERAVRVVSSRHEALRTCFIPDEVDHSKAYQKVLPSSPIRLICKNISSKEDMLSEYEELKKHDFDMASGELLRLVLLTQSPSSHYLLVFYHHIVMDGISFQVFLADLEKAYNGESLGAAPRQYPEFSVAQHKAIESGEMQPHLDFWRSIFPEGTQPPVLPLMPMARTNARVPMGVFDTHQVITYLGADVTARVRALAKAQRSTPFHLYLAAFKTLLFAFTNADDLTIGVADGARNDGGVMNSIGFFLNLLTLRFRRDEGQSFNDAITDARQTSHAALEHSPLPFDVLLNELGIERSSKHSPFFQAFIDYRQGLQAFQPFGNCQLEMSPDIHTGKTAYDITVDVTETEEESVIMVRGQKSIYDLTATQLFADTFAHFVDVLTATPSMALPEIPMFSQKQLTDAVTIGRGPKLVSDWPETLPRRIDQVAESNQDKVALLDDSGKDLTYREMIDRIEAIAEALQNAGVGPGKRVPVFEQATADWPCSMLAIMRLGAIYVPLDLRNPVSRLAAVAKDCDAHAVLVDSTTVGDAPGLEVPSATIINVNDLGRKASASIPNQSRADSPAAILYTSGSTGTPKGIMVTHAGLRNEIEGYTKMWKLGAERALQQSAFTFNHSSDQMYTGLVNGGSVYMVPWEKRGNPLEITQIMKDFAITYTKATPAEYSLWMQYGGDALKSATSWRHAFGGGESLTTSVTQEFANLGLTNLRMLNSYGPTEISISSTKMEIDYRDTESLERMGRIPCGFSLPNYFMYAVDEQMNPMPAGMPGQLAIGGAGVSLGYLKNKELTDKHFVHNPFANEEDVANGWTRMYLTGDIGHLNPDGAMVFRSRVSGDTQVKIRGLRIELADIESNIVACSGGVVREAVVTLREGDPEFLVSHVVFNPQQAAAIADKEAFLQQLLNNLEVPQYMVPVAAIPLDQFPLTKHNKVDRKLLKTMPLPERVGVSAETEEEELEMTEMMVQVKKLWKDVLGKGIESLGMAINPSTSFFAAGGNSLLIIRLQSRIRQELDISIPLVDLLGAKTLAQMARKIEESASVKAIDWNEETATPDIPSFLEGVSASVAQTGKTVLITGATGFLAKYLLPQLDARADVDTIHCVAVRDTEKLFSSPKIVSHTGDLTSPLLGLSEEVFRELSSKADVILHLGAARSFWDSYHVLRSTNVLPTKEVVKLAAPRHIPIHYISTGDVFKGATAGPTSAAEHLPPTDGSSGYTASRWASERILERSADIGIPSAVYRLLPASKNTGAVADVQKELLRCADVAGALPENSGWAGRIDVLPTDAVIQQLFKGMLDESVSGKTLFQNMESHVMVDGPELVSCLEEHRSNRPDLETCPMLRWFGRVKEAGFTYFLASYDATLESSDVKLQMAR